MEIISFTFGVLSVIATSMMVVVVLGIVKVLKLQKQIKELHGELSHTHTQIFDGDKNVHQRIDRELYQIQRQVDDTRSYIDSRIDKVVLQGSLVGSMRSKKTIN